MSKAEKIRKEIERLKAETFDNKELSLEEIIAVRNCYNNLLFFIDSLEEEPVSNDLEEAAHLYVDTTIEWFDSEGNPCCYPAFIAGAQWQKEQMVEEACKWLELHDSYAVPTNIKVRDLKEHLSSK
jgi:hypothetical protein